MIQKLIITDSNGYPHYKRDFDEKLPPIDNTLLSGLISTIGILGKKLFNKEIAKIAFGLGINQSHIFIVSKELLHKRKTIYFVFFLKGEYDEKLVKNVATTIYIENKDQLLSSDNFNNKLRARIDKIIDTRYSEI
ncbi:MAG: hypothetical protein EU547_03750 [Promethearchaeota archaeon]|nr:MAG: hypothetical protein EU547_03750 [Candidatus Lokiarchaeota archaeon]